MTQEKRILLLLEDDTLSRFLREELIIKGGYLVSFQGSAQDAFAALKQDTFDLIISHYGLSDMEGGALIKELKRLDPSSVIVTLLDREDPAAVEEIARLGVYDFLAKPINFEKLFFLIRKGIELHQLLLAQHKLTHILQEQNANLQKQNTLLSKRIEESTKNLTKLYEDLRMTYLRTIRVLAQAIDARDHYTHSHSQNVAKYSVAVANELRLSAKDIETIREASELHDLGKIGIQDSILLKPAKLEPQEWEEIKKHPQIGAQILEPLTFLNAVTELVRQHHEHFDGSGYPSGRKGEDILLGARILHLADAYESMTSARSYRKIPLSKEAAIEEIRRNAGSQFDPRVVDAFLKISAGL